MTDPVEALAEKVDAIGQKLDAHASSVDARFHEVTSALVEQRQYTEFAFDRLRSEMTAGFSAMTANFARLGQKLDLLIDRMAGGHSGA